MFIKTEALPFLEVKKKNNFHFLRPYTALTKASAKTANY